MSPWPSVKLSKVAKVTSGDGAPQEASAFGETGAPFIRAGSLVPLLDGTHESQLEQIPEAESLKRRLRTYPAHTVVFAKSGMSCTKGLVYELKGPAHVVNHLAAVECGRDLNPRFLLRWFQSNSPARLIENDAYPSIKISAIRSEQIPLPPLPEQKRIAAILDAADALRAKRRESLAQLDTLLQSTFLEMFGDPRRQGSTGRIQTRPLRMGSLTKIRTGKLDANAADEDGEYPFFTCAVNTLRINEAAFEAKAVLVAGNGALNVKYYEGKFNAYQRTYVIESKDELTVHPRFLHIFLDLYVSELRKQAIGGVIKYIKLPYLKDAMVELPDLASQRRFAAIVESIEQQKATQRAHLAELDTFFASLQSRAFRGDL